MLRCLQYYVIQSSAIVTLNSWTGVRTLLQSLAGFAELSFGLLEAHPSRL